MGDPIGMTGLQFFGAMAASISHDIKNRMAIINEQAGLLADFVTMAQNGRPLDAERLERLATSVRTQVSLTDGIIKNMNQFAHSIDHPSKSVELGELLAFMLELFKRRASNSGIRLTVQSATQPVTLQTSPFLLMNLIWLCLLPLMSEKPVEQELTLSYGKQDSVVFIVVKLKSTELDRGLSLTEEIKNLARELEIKLQLNTNKNELKIELPLQPLEGTTD